MIGKYEFNALPPLLALHMILMCHESSRSISNYKYKIFANCRVNMHKGTHLPIERKPS